MFCDYWPTDYKCYKMFWGNCSDKSTFHLNQQLTFKCLDLLTLIIVDYILILSQGSYRKTWKTQGILWPFLQPLGKLREFYSAKHLWSNRLCSQNKWINKQISGKWINKWSHSLATIIITICQTSLIGSLVWDVLLAPSQGLTWPFWPTEFSLSKVTLRRGDDETLNINQK